MAWSRDMIGKVHNIHSNLTPGIEMATAQRTRPRDVVGALRRATWQLKSASLTASAQRRIK